MSAWWKCTDFEDCEGRMWRAAESRFQNPELPDSVLLIGLGEEDREVVKEVYGNAPIRIHSASTLAEVEQVLRQARVPVIIADADVSGHCWTGVWSLIQSGSVEPRPRLVVASSIVDEGFCSQVLDLGAFDIAAKPFFADEIRWILEDAWLEWKHQLHLLDNGNGLRHAAESAG